MPRLVVISALALAACARPGPIPLPDDQTTGNRAACAYEKGALPQNTLPYLTRLGDAMPIDHIVLVMQENRSFDHYFSRLTHGGVRTAPDAIAAIRLISK